jgi:hypothetical protein
MKKNKEHNGETRNAQTILAGKPKREKIFVSSSKRREDNIKIILNIAASVV